MKDIKKFYARVQLWWKFDYCWKHMERRSFINKFCHLCTSEETARFSVAYKARHTRESDLVRKAGLIR